MKVKSDDSTVQQLVPQKNNANAANANKDAGAAKKATGSQEQSNKNETEKKNKPDDKAAQSSVNKSKPQSGSYTYAVQDRHHAAAYRAMPLLDLLVPAPNDLAPGWPAPLRGRS